MMWKCVGTTRRRYQRSQSPEDLVLISFEQSSTNASVQFPPRGENFVCASESWFAFMGEMFSTLNEFFENRLKEKFNEQKILFFRVSRSLSIFSFWAFTEP